MGTETMTFAPTVEQLLKTPTGRQIITELEDLERQAESEENAEQRKQLRALNKQAKELLPKLENARVAVLGMAADLVAEFKELDGVYSDVRDLRNRFRRLGRGIAMPESKIKEDGVPGIIADLQSMSRRFGRPI